MKILPRLENETAIEYLNRIGKPEIPNELPKWWQFRKIYNLHKSLVSSNETIEELSSYLETTRLELQTYRKCLYTVRNHPDLPESISRYLGDWYKHETGRDCNVARRK